MGRFTHKVRIAILKTMEALGTSAANLASSAKLRVNELTLETRRREILTDFSLQAFELWQKGVELPAPLGGMLTELSDIESRLSVLRAQKYAKVNADTTKDRKAKSSDPEAPAPLTLTLEPDAAALDGDAEDAETAVELAATEDTFAEEPAEEQPTGDKQAEQGE